MLLFERTFELWRLHLLFNRNLRRDVAVQRPGRGWRPVSIAAWPRILVHATNVFCDKGYAAASMRDLSRASGVSLSGLYYYFESKEELLYLIQKHTFSTIVDRLRERLDEVADPADRIRMFILNHLEYFLANQKAMKVLSHEDDVLKNGFGSRDRSHQARVLPHLHRTAGRLQAGARAGVFQPDCRAQPVWHDELDLYLV